MKAKTAREEKQAGTRERILQAAGQLFAEQGFHGTGIREISRLAEVNLAAVNYHFGSKEQLYEAALREVFLHRSEQFDTPIEDELNLSPEDALRRHIRRFLEIGLDPLRPVWHRTLHGREMQEPSAAMQNIARDIIRQRFARMRARIQRVFEKKVDEEMLNFCTLSVLGQCLFYFRTQALLPHLRPNWKMDAAAIDQLADQITTFSIGGIRTLQHKENGMDHA